MKMAVAVILDFDGGTIDQYEQVIEKMGFVHEGTGGPGGLFHWVTKTDNGFRVTDVWATREDFEKFSEEKIGPYSQEAGLPQPQIEFVEVHNYLTAA
jgi:hypothetical protein